MGGGSKLLRPRHSHRIQQGHLSRRCYRRGPCRRVFYKCPNHRISPNPCNHYYWENGEDNYIDFLVRNGYNFGTADYGNDIAFEETEDELEESRVHKMADVVKKMDLVLKKMDELAEIGRNVFAAILFLIVVMLYVAVAR
uniref:Uncharacterized protein n=1 Tax=Avena sativa TaxID=4498 RepID=A0ACD5X276_AVESA